MSNLTNKIKQVIKDNIHKTKSEAKHSAELSKEQWAVFDIETMSEEILAKILPLIEAYAFIPCCHTSGMHDPTHFEKGIICESQKAEAFVRLCTDLEINPVTKSKLNCYWCTNSPEKRIGENVKLFKEEPNPA